MRAVPTTQLCSRTANAEINGSWCARRTLPIYFSPSRLIRFFYSGIVSIPKRLSRPNSAFRTSGYIAPSLPARWRPRRAFRFPPRDSKRIGKFVVAAGARREALDMYPRKRRKPTDTAKSPNRFERNARRICPTNILLPSHHPEICPTPERRRLNHSTAITKGKVMAVSTRIMRRFWSDHKSANVCLAGGGKKANAA